MLHVTNWHSNALTLLPLGHLFHSHIQTGSYLSYSYTDTDTRIHVNMHSGTQFTPLFFHRAHCCNFLNKFPSINDFQSPNLFYRFTPFTLQDALNICRSKLVMRKHSTAICSLMLAKKTWAKCNSSVSLIWLRVTVNQTKRILIQLSSRCAHLWNWKPILLKKS